MDLAIDQGFSGDAKDLCIKKRTFKGPIFVVTTWICQEYPFPGDARDLCTEKEPSKDHLEPSRVGIGTVD